MLNLFISPNCVKIIGKYFDNFLVRTLNTLLRLPSFCSHSLFDKQSHRHAHSFTCLSNLFGRLRAHSRFVQRLITFNVLIGSIPSILFVHHSFFFLRCCCSSSFGRCWFLFKISHHLTWTFLWNLSVELWVCVCVYVLRYDICVSTENRRPIG